MAGYSRRAFYSNFENKDELICAALERHIRIEHAKVEAIFLRDVSPMERLAILRAFYIQVSADVEQFREALGVYFDRLLGVSAQNLPALT